MITVESFIDKVSKEETELLDKFEMQRKKFNRRHTMYCIEAFILAVMFLLIAASSIAITCLTKLRLTGLILLCIDAVTAVYAFIQVKKQLIDFIIEFDVLRTEQISAFETMHNDNVEKFKQLNAFHIFNRYETYRCDILMPLIAKGLSEFEIGQIILDAKDASNSADEFSMKIDQIKETYNLKENN